MHKANLSHTYRLSQLFTIGVVTSCEKSGKAYFVLAFSCSCSALLGKSHILTADQVMLTRVVDLSGTVDSKVQLQLQNALSSPSRCCPVSFQSHSHYFDAPVEQLSNSPRAYINMFSTLFMLALAGSAAAQSSSTASVATSTSLAPYFQTTPETLAGLYPAGHGLPICTS